MCLYLKKNRKGLNCRPSGRTTTEHLRYKRYRLLQPSAQLSTNVWTLISVSAVAERGAEDLKLLIFEGKRFDELTFYLL